MIKEKISTDRVFHYFREISKIPRCSKKEELISQYLYDWAKSKQLEVIKDKQKNIIIFKEASKGYENAPAIILQGHMDMVCEKNADKVHDFERDPISLVYKNDFIYADGTTLGADNGIAVAMILAILESNSLEHPAIEALITTDEETGMTGVANLDGSMLKGRIMINLDSGEEGTFLAGCAGGGRLNFSTDIEYMDGQFENAFKLVVKGLKGGHSGAEIHLDRGNANKILGRLLHNIVDLVELVEIGGGSADNAIPREAYALIKTNNQDEIRKKIQDLLLELKNEYKFSDPEIDIKIEAIDSKHTKVFTQKLFEQYLNLINLVPSGPLKITNEIDLVILSNNPGVLKIVDKKLRLTCAPRSSIASSLEDFVAKMEQLGSVTGFKLEKSAFYPGWEYAKDSLIRDICLGAYKAIFGKEAEVKAVHAGLECGFIMEKIPGLDAISLGPNMYNLHSPDEHLSISSTERTYELLNEIIRRIK
ncbi:MAG: aminoacyl-histidine dipeptidase [Eubacteriales bacterium]|nr:aminoacyl-histidine dipeptidase [Eubacteriales bacterium]